MTMSSHTTAEGGDDNAMLCCLCVPSSCRPKILHSSMKTICGIYSYKVTHSEHDKIHKVLSTKLQMIQCQSRTERLLASRILRFND